VKAINLSYFNGFNAELNPICHLLALLGVHHILHVSEIRVNVLYVVRIFFVKTNLNPLHAELNPICHLLALLGAHHILHVSKIRVNVLYVVRIFFVKTNLRLMVGCCIRHQLI